MTTKYRGEGAIIMHTAGTAGRSSGDVVVVRTGATGMIGVATADAAASTAGPVAIEGVFELSKNVTSGAGVMAVGDILYWDIADGNISTQASANVKAGVCVKAAAAATTTVWVKLIPSKA